jgi:hypothetical protein
LGDWINRKLDKGVGVQEAMARAELVKCGISEKELRQQWQKQKEAQMSVRARK